MTLFRVPNARPGHDSVEREIYGMDGLTVEDIGAYPFISHFIHPVTRLKIALVIFVGHELSFLLTDLIFPLLPFCALCPFSRVPKSYQPSLNSPKIKRSSERAHGEERRDGSYFFRRSCCAWPSHCRFGLQQCRVFTRRVESQTTALRIQRGEVPAPTLPTRFCHRV